jgi:hypothetical protein
MTFSKISQNVDFTPKMTFFEIFIPYFHIFAKMVDEIKKLIKCGILDHFQPF